MSIYKHCATRYKKTEVSTPRPRSQKIVKAVGARMVKRCAGKKLREAHFCPMPHEPPVSWHQVRIAARSTAKIVHETVHGAMLYACAAQTVHLSVILLSAHCV